MMGETCLDCKDRYNNCHSRCRKYKQYRKKLDNINEKRNENNEYGEYLRDTKERFRRLAL